MPTQNRSRDENKNGSADANCKEQLSLEGLGVDQQRGFGFEALRLQQCDFGGRWQRH